MSTHLEAVGRKPRSGLELAMLLWDHAAPLIGCYFLAALLIPFLVKYFRQRTFYIAALMPLSVLVWTLSHTREAFGTGSQEIAEFYQWSSA
ncbi:MAG: hypothetical protein E7E54_05350, partial [Varibaculum cambriense]|nr:hypothetical protein [Varibaculum cambriense]